jgi:hypothetical protein
VSLVRFRAPLHHQTKIYLFLFEFDVNRNIIVVVSRPFICDTSLKFRSTCTLSTASEGFFEPSIPFHKGLPFTNSFTTFSFYLHLTVGHYLKPRQF